MGANTEARRAPALEEEDMDFAAAAREGKSPERSKSADFLSTAGPSRALEPRAPFVATHGLRGGGREARLAAAAAMAASTAATTARGGTGAASS